MRGAIRVIVDNVAGAPSLRHCWGFACLLDGYGARVLFDTGPDGDILLHNLSTLAVDLLSIEHVVISHAHWDHVGGLPGLLRYRRQADKADGRDGLTGLRPKDVSSLQVWVPAGFPARGCEKIQALGGVCREVAEAEEILPGLWSTGALGEGLVEQGLLLTSQQGPVLLTGCAHPGIVSMCEQAGALGFGPVAWVLGGFHLMAAAPGETQKVIQDFRALGVRRVGPAHCTGLSAQNAFAAAYGRDCDEIGCGSCFAFNPSVAGGL